MVRAQTRPDPAPPPTRKPAVERRRRPSLAEFSQTSLQDLFWDLLTFDRLLTGPVIHLIYWAGLALFVLGGFSIVGAAVGMAVREEGLMGPLLALPIIVGGFLTLGAGLLIWRSFCEFYVAVFRIADDLSAMRYEMQQGGGGPAKPRVVRPATSAPVTSPPATSDAPPAP